MRAWLLFLVLLGCARHASEADLVDVHRADLVVDVEVEGDLEAVDSIDIKPPAIREMSCFKVTSLADDGSDVAEGAPIANLDASDLEHSLETARNDVAGAQKRLDRHRQEVELSHQQSELSVLEAESGAKRARLAADVPNDLVASISLREDQIDSQIAQLGLDETKRNADLGRRSDDADLRDLVDYRDSAQRQVDQLQRDLGLLAVTAPRAGTVVYPTAGGDKRKIGDSICSSDAIVKLVALDAMLGLGAVDEIDIGRVAVSQPVTLRLDALPDLSLHGAVKSITTTVQQHSDADPSKVVRIELSIATAGANPGLRPGMRFRGRIETARVPGVLQVPSDAVFVEADGPVAYRETTRGLERVAIALGRRSSDAIEVTRGLEAGDRVSRVAPEAP